MSDLKDFIYRLSNSMEHSFDEIKLRFRKRMGWETKVNICPYISFGNKSTLFVKGRVLHDYGIEISNKDEFWDNLVNMYKRFNSHEVKGAKLRVTFQGIEKEFFTDEDGYFGESIEYNQDESLESLWCYPELELLSSPVPFASPLKSKASVLVPGSKCRFGIISDIDDTIIKTDAIHITKMIYHTFANNAHSRLAFPGVAAFYRALQGGISGDENNPIFYVSSSPWNLYDFLVDFLSINGIPSGPLFLKDYGFTHNKIFAEGHNQHKPKKVKKIMDAYPDMSFILIGDSGQEDPEIYSEILKIYPGRILAVYIRDVTDGKRDQEIYQKWNSQKVDMVYSEDSYAAAQHAAKHGFINSEFLPAIMNGKELDEGKEE